MGKKVLKLLLIGFGGLTVLTLLFAFMSGGLPDYTKDHYKRTKEVLQKEFQRISSGHAKLKSKVEGDSDYLGKLNKREQWLSSLARIEKDYKKEMDAFLKTGDELIKQDKSDDSSKIFSLTTTMGNKRKVFVQEYDRIEKKIERFAYYKDNFDKLREQAKLNYEFISNYDLNPLELKVQKAQTDWPVKQADLNNRVRNLRSIKNNAATLWKAFQKEAEKSPISYDLAGKTADQIIESKKILEESSQQISSLTDQLYYSYSKILTDMRTSPRYQNHLKTIKVYFDNRNEVKEQWVDVSSTHYNKNRNNLGMTVESKDLGKYDFEAKRFASPPGYNYIGDRRYGRWERDSYGNSFWAFYGQYAFMRSLFWGPGYYSPIYRSNYNTYRRYRNVGRTYYGRTSTGRPKYGSRGSYTRTRYANSRYMTKSYRGSNYSGSRYGGSYGK